jgi:hypothetical protein
MQTGPQAGFKDVAGSISMHSLYARLAAFTCLAVLTLALSASSAPAAQAAVTIGQLPSDGTSGCGANRDLTQAAVGAGAGYALPATGGIVFWTITSWSTKANAVAVQELKLKFFRPAGGLTYTAVAHDGPRPLAPNEINVFSSNVVARAGDVLGLHNSTNAAGCTFPTGLGPADMTLSSNGDLADGQSATFMSQINQRLNITAVAEPTNTFTIGTTTRNKKKGTATLTVDVPNPGELTGSGKGVKASSAAGAVISKSVAAGPAQLLIKAKGKKKRKLNETGKVKLNVAVTYTPTSGSASTQSRKLKLKKRL